VSTILILVTAEFLPKTIFRQSSNFFLNIFAVPVFIFYILFLPIAKFTVIFSNAIIKLFFKTNIKTPENITFGRMDLNNFLTVAENENKNSDDIENEVKIFKNALYFSKIKVRECFVPRNEIIAVDIDDSIDDVKEILIKTKVSKVLVYKDSIDNIIGYVHTFDIFKKPKSIKAALNKIIVVTETMPVNKLLNQFIQSHHSLALVVDEFGGTSGIVTMEDIIEEIIGEIEDEHDVDENLDNKISENEFMLSGRIEIDYLNEKYNLQIPDSHNYETIAGLILNIHEQIPDKGQIIQSGNLKFEIIKVEGPKIKKVKLTIID
jgi:CBS domain containing-hemolysin-like protein